jgi:hypothetical protein
MIVICRVEKGIAEMKLKMASLALAAVMMFIAVLAPMSAEAAKPAPGPVAIPVTGTGANGVAFAGTANVTQFAVQNGQVVAIGTLTGTVTNAAGTVLGSVTNQPFTAPVDRAASAVPSGCTILNLVLGPLDLELLGLQVHLDRVVLNITAVPGAGLLGDLLCAVDNLLSGAGNLNALSQLLNNILAILSRL